LNRTRGDSAEDVINILADNSQCKSWTYQLHRLKNLSATKPMNPFRTWLDTQALLLNWRYSDYAFIPNKLMSYTVTPTVLPDVFILEPKVFGDSRGFFFESFNERDFVEANGITQPFVQDNHSKSARGVLRGLHYQIEHPQGKLVRVSQGAVFDVAVDMRLSSANFGRWMGVVLSADNKQQLWIPPGFAHGFLVLSDSAEFLYKTTDYWYPEHERSLLWSDPTVGVQWPLDSAPLLAAKDAIALQLHLVPGFA
jgi:dTDP-4-dehydrorhamnose 3,5-epimerase